LNRCSQPKIRHCRRRNRRDQRRCLLETIARTRSSHFPLARAAVACLRSGADRSGSIFLRWPALELFGWGVARSIARVTREHRGGAREERPLTRRHWDRRCHFARGKGMEAPPNGTSPTNLAHAEPTGPSGRRRHGAC
jgi:hypothetical protein